MDALRYVVGPAGAGAGAPPEPDAAASATAAAAAAAAAASASCHSTRPPPSSQPKDCRGAPRQAVS